ncbi:MAG: proton-conducting membrane transporter [Dehalococcoidia bacterium]|nr:proton-conducting membrane transporter [Dehalococcoidia bacterium]|tara:strand:+ start:2832 stop:3329 length:498 start_codon:yes stop_codon:yes gene_type:complete
MVFEMTWLVFTVLSGIIVGGGLGVVTTRNVVHAALFLLVSLIGVAGFYVLLLSEFLAVVQIFIYVGAIVIVLLFGIMLTRSGEYPRIADNEQWPAAVLMGLGFFALLALALLTHPNLSDERNEINLSILGESLFTDWALPFEIASILLLIALVGAVVLAREDKKS